MGDILPGLQKKAGLNDEIIANIRVYEAHNARVYKELSRDYSVTSLNDYSTLYAEEIPEEERNAQEGDKSIFAFHFDKEINRPHSIPFKFLVKPVCISASCGPEQQLIATRANRSQRLRNDS